MNHKLVEMGLQKRRDVKYVRDINFFEKTPAGVTAAEEKTANELAKNIKNYPHALVLAGLMDRQISAEKAWIIPYKIKEIRGGVFDIKDLVTLSETEYINIFENNKLHRFNKKMAIVFHKAVNRIQDEYGGDVSKIWTGKPSSAKVVFEFSLFYGCGIKISTMLANILVRHFLIELSDYYSIDVSPDVHVKRIMKRTGLVPTDAKTESIVYKARELYPEFPGIIDNSCWEIGRKYCKEKPPDCEKCPINDVCKMVL